MNITTCNTLSQIRIEQSKTSGKAEDLCNHLLLPWMCCCYERRGQCWRQEEYLSIASSPLSQGSATHMGAPSLTASHTKSSYDYVLKTNIRLNSCQDVRSPFCFSSTSREEAGLTTLTFYLQPLRPYFPQWTL